MIHSLKHIFVCIVDKKNVANAVLTQKKCVRTNINAKTFSHIFVLTHSKNILIGVDDLRETFSSLTANITFLSKIILEKVEERMFGVMTCSSI